MCCESATLSACYTLSDLALTEGSRMKNQFHETQEGPVISRRRILKAGMFGVGALAANQLLGCAAKGQPKAESPISNAPDAARYVPIPNKSLYTLHIQETDLNPDGAKVVHGITTNGMFPAKEIRLKQGDMFRAVLDNNLSDQSTSLHWHGLLVPAAMDGVPDVSHVPIKPHEVFVYEFPILQSGTYWYHSHFGFQEQIGLGGPFIIEASDESLVYDHDCVIFLGDWTHNDPSTLYGNLKTPKVGAMDMNMDPDLSDVQYNAFLINGRANNDPWLCTARKGDRIRFRIINGGTSTFFRFMIDGHSLMITHADGIAVQPIEVDHFLIGMGECYDAMLTVRDSGSFTIRAIAMDNSGQAIGILHTPDATPKGNLSMPKLGSRQLNYDQLRSIEPTTLTEGPMRRFTLDLTGNMRNYVWSINNQIYPDADPLRFNQGDRVRIDSVNKTMMWHPMHLHGHFFRLLMPGVDTRNCPLKHTVSVPPKKTISLEFFADNPGKWFFHCHNLYHLEAGMAREFIYSV
jgi:FtsP/CotA-like multicopper oxidase with cupredoxin domain